jgi:hypothetical protein
MDTASLLNENDRSIASEALGMIQLTPRGPSTSSVFDQLFASAQIAKATRTAAAFPHHHLTSALVFRDHLLTVLCKVVWLNNHREPENLDSQSWISFAATDIVTFHVLIRSLFDELASLASGVAPQGGVNRDSFAKLRTWLRTGPDNVHKLGEDLANVILDCEWFESLRRVRDDLVHHGAQTFVFPEPGRILFQIHLGPSALVQMPKAVMFNESVVDFTTYSALTMARLMVFLDAFSEVVFTMSDDVRSVRNAGVGSIHPGLGILAFWLQDLLDGQARGHLEG